MNWKRIRLSDQAEQVPVPGDLEQHSIKSNHSPRFVMAGLDPAISPRLPEITGSSPVMTTIGDRTPADSVLGDLPPPEAAGAAPVDGTADIAVAPAPAKVNLAAPTSEAEPFLYPEDLADFDEFDFGGATFRGKAGSAGTDAADATKTADPADHRPLSARDLPRHQRPGLRFVEPRPLPLRRRPDAPRAIAADPRPRPRPISPAPCADEPGYIKARALPLRPHGNPRQSKDPT